jgi:hypothetical protein
MLRFIPYALVTLIFISVGLYFIFFTRHFLGWTTLANQKLHIHIDNHLCKPLLETRAQINYRKLQANGALNLFTWSIRIIGIALIAYFVLVICKIFSSI